MDVNDIPVIAMTRHGVERTTMAKAIADLDDELAKARAARRCESCGRYQTHEQLKTVPTEDGGTQRLCSDCLDDDPAAKQLYQRGWAEAAEVMDEALAKMRRGFPTDQLAKAQAFDRLARFDAIGSFNAMLAKFDREQAATNRLTRTVKVEQARREATRAQKKAAKIRRKAEKATMRKAAARAALDAALARQVGLTAELDQLGARVNTVCRNAERAYGAVAKQRDVQAIAELARQDQSRADWAYKASQTTDPILREVYLAKAAGEVVDGD